MAAQLNDLLAAERSGIVGSITVAEILELYNRPLTLPFSGRFLADPNEINGWGIQGPSDDTNAQDLGDSNVTNLSRLAGGFMFPYDAELLSIRMWHRNNNAGVDPFGFVLTKQEKNNNSNTVVSDNLIHEVNDNGGVGPRDYASTVTQFTELDLSGLANRFLPENDVINLAVSFPTADNTNRYVEVMSGILVYRRTV